MFADNLLRSTPFGQRALELGAVNPDAAINTIELAKSLDALKAGRAKYPHVKFSDFIHNTQHPKFDQLMQEVVEREIDLLKEAKGLSRMKNSEFIPQMTKENIQEVWQEALTKVKAGLMGEDKDLYKRIEERTRPGKKSLAEVESSENTEVV
jgi:hypothetical protein